MDSGVAPARPCTATAGLCDLIRWPGEAPCVAELPYRTVQRRTSNATYATSARGCRDLMTTTIKTKASSRYRTGLPATTHRSSLLPRVKMFVKPAGLWKCPGRTRAIVVAPRKLQERQVSATQHGGLPSDSGTTVHPRNSVRRAISGRRIPTLHATSGHTPSSVSIPLPYRSSALRCKARKRS